LYTEIRHFFREYVLSDELVENREFMSMGEEERVEVSEQEFAVLRELSLNSRLGTVTLAKRLKMSPITIKNIIKKLLKLNVIKGFRILFDYSLLNYGYYWIHIDVVDFGNWKKLTHYVQMFPETVYLSETIGGNDLEFGVQVNEEKGVQGLLMDIFDKFSEGITDYQYFKVLENKKVIYLPPK
jgi:DNA-binding Lrp family transcriptional regulator